MELELDKQIIVSVGILKGDHKDCVIDVNTTLRDLLDNGLSDQLLSKGIFDHICHPCDYYVLISIAYAL